MFAGRRIPHMRIRRQRSPVICVLRSVDRLNTVVLQPDTHVTISSSPPPRDEGRRHLLLKHRMSPEF